MSQQRDSGQAGGFERLGQEVSSSKSSFIEQGRRALKLRTTPIDFVQLIADGILRRQGAWYEVLDMPRLPEHARVQVKAMKQQTGKTLLVKFFPQKKRKA